MAVSQSPLPFQPSLTVLLGERAGMIQKRNFHPNLIYAEVSVTVNHGHILAHGFLPSLLPVAR